MTRTSFSKVLLASVFALLLSMPTLAAERRIPSGARRAKVSVSITEAFLQFWSSMTGGLTKEGCTIDPDGRCIVRAVAPTSSDAGCTIDPNGHCVSGH
ncbi:MAG TPA: hypothetical protein VGH73_03150 [Thermoanaerobaculia bacterium]|jgi:hypothetical protein